MTKTKLLKQTIIEMKTKNINKTFQILNRFFFFNQCWNEIKKLGYNI